MGVGVGLALLGVGLAEVDVGEALVLLGLALLDVDEDSAGPDGEKMPAWVSRTPTSAKRTSTMRAMSGHVHGLRPLRCGSSTGSS
ncbi:hypothetical protein D3C84_1205460 [compost metagenome]